MIRIGIIGCGRILAAHLKGYRLLREAGIDDFRITALCARNPKDALGYLREDPSKSQRSPVSSMPGDPLAVPPEYLDNFQSDTEVEVFKDYSELISSNQVDAVNDFTIHRLHHPIALQCARLGKDLLTQKPLAIDPDQGLDMVEHFQRAKRILGVCENWRFRPQTRHARWAIDSGLIGTLQQLHFLNVGNWWAPRQVVANTPWRHQLQEGGGITLDIGPHLFHWVQHLAGPLTWVQGHVACCESVRIMPSPAGETIEVPCDADDSFHATFQTTKGVIGSLTASWAGAGQGMVLGQGPQVFGSEGSINGNRLTLANGQSLDLEAHYLEHCPKERQAKEFPMKLTDGFALLHHDWLQGIRNHRPPEVGGQEGLRDLQCAHAVLDSHRSGKRIEFNHDSPDSHSTPPPSAQAKD